MNIREYLENHKLLTDGAMGTYFDSIEKENYICSEEANITNPALVREIHRSYVKNGAQLLRSNTFLANEGTFLSLTQAKAEAFENITLKQLIIAGYQLAKETAQEVYQEEYPIFAAADIGPILEERDSEEADILQQYYEICDSFLEAGADIFIHACAVANFQIGQTPELIEIASKNYLNMDKTEMTRQVTEVMLGKMREVIGQMDLKELMCDRESFNHKR